MKILHRKLKRAAEIWRKHGWRGVNRHAQSVLSELQQERAYRKWIIKNEMTEADRQILRRQIEEFRRKPLISVILPVFNVEEKWLRKCIESVLRQIYENWELCIADDKSPGSHIRRILEEYAARDSRIKVVFRSENGHISAASNTALELATGEFCVLLDHDDELSQDALFYVAGELNEHPETAFIYSDEDVIDERGRRFKPKFKPDFSRDFLYSLNLVTHLSAYQTEILRKIGGFRKGFEGSQDYDLALRFIEEIDEKQIRHIPRILYHWRAIQGSVALSSDEKPYAHERARRAIREHLERTGKRARVSETSYNFHRVRYELPENAPGVSLVLSIDDDFAAAVRETVEAFFSETAYPNFEIVALCSEKAAGRLETISRRDFRIIMRENGSEAENFNRAVVQAKGEILCFIDAALRPQAADWLEELASFAVQTEIGAVGAKILGPDDRLRHGGLIVGAGGTVGIVDESLPRDLSGNFFRSQVVNNFSAISLFSLTTRRELFESLGGFEAQNLPNALFDADFCLRLGEKNLRVTFTPYAELRQAATRDLLKKPSAPEREYFRRRWRGKIEKDPFYNPNLSLEGRAFTIRL